VSVDQPPSGWVARVLVMLLLVCGCWLIVWVFDVGAADTYGVVALHVAAGNLADIVKIKSKNDNGGQNDG